MRCGETSCGAALQRSASAVAWVSRFAWSANSMSNDRHHTVLHTPSRAVQEASAMWRFIEASSVQHGIAPPDYAALHAWSIAEPEAFHASLWDFLEIIGSRGERIVQRAANIQHVRFFPDARLNYAENLLYCADEGPAL